ncbi:nucleoside hydrolase [Paenibacillus sp. Leaf72]|uniref:nucleoside hydrolase n=1 Tax=Paenibacillus sp. Leaf72 TaxID=1736234 RepID=UPI0006FF6A1E|nr:nucleoside hydrolase [Paenibacillus sp. Leaf72]KQN97706.1 nucleoside hydrolase [Paenibacillus sp. Leaf72]
MKLPFDVPESKKIRLIINTDAKNEADDQFAIVHALLTPRFRIKGIIAAQFEKTASMMNRKDTMQQSYDEIEKVLSIMGLQEEVPYYKGAVSALENEETPVPSEGAAAIVHEAMKEDSSPLYVVFLGPLTDMASALLMEPRISDRLTVVWIGGGHWPLGGWEYNLFNDIAAANVVFQSSVELWQVPHTVYTTMRVSIAEMMYKVKPYGEIGQYLFQQLIDFNNWAAEAFKDSPWPKGEMWSLGDSPAISLLLDEHEYGYEMKPAPRITEDMYYVHDQKERMIRVYHFVDVRFTLEDMFAKLALTYGS